MSLEFSSHRETGAIYDLPDVTSEQALAETCEQLVENGVGVEYGSRLEGDIYGNRGQFEIRVRPAVPEERRRRIAEEIGIRLVIPKLATP